MVKLRRIKVFFAWLLLSFCFAGLPAALIYTAISRYLQTIENERQVDLRVRVQQALNEATGGIHQEKFWCRMFSEKFVDFENAQTSREEIIAWIEECKTRFPGVFEYLVWNQQGIVVAGRGLADRSPSELSEVFKELVKATGNPSEVSYAPSGRPDIKMIREILGPQYIGSAMENNIHPKRYGFAWPDSSYKKPLLWARFIDNGGYLLLFNHDCIDADNGVLARLEEFSRGQSLKFGLYKPDAGNEIIWPDGRPGQFAGLAGQLEWCEQQLESFAAADGYYLATGFLTHRLRVFGCCSIEYDQNRRVKMARAGAAVVLLLLSPFLIYTWRIMLLGAPGTLSIRRRITFVFFFASALPFLAMTIFAREHYAQKRDAALKAIHQRSVALIQSFDERMQSLFSRYEVDMKTYFNTWADQMKGRALDDRTNAQLIARCRDNLVESFYVIASETPLAGTYKGVFQLAETIEERPKDGRDEENNSQNAQVANLIGKRIMRELNGQPQSNKEADRLELLFESLMQKSFSEITHNFIRAMGGLSPWGFGKTLNLALLNFMSAGGSEKIDYMGLAIWSTLPVQRRYLEKTISEVNRNPTGLRIVVKDSVFDKFYPEHYQPTPEVREYFKRLSEKPSEEVEIIKSAGVEYMVTGFNGKRLQRFQIIGLFPLSRIDSMISRQRSDLLVFVAFCLLLAAWLAQLLSQSFLMPLAELGAAALAIEKRDFSRRISCSGSDEFGRTGALLNDVMADFANLEVARTVQASLFPQSGLEMGGFRVYGKSLAMNELGGDYYDYFAVDERSFAALMGDVAGHGVGAALIMAMAKAGVLNSREYLQQPVKVLERLHELVYGSKTRKQKKIMTFQYLVVDVTAGRASYANAGGCSPLFYRRETRSASEITLAGAALGAFKKANFSQTEIVFAHGDLMVFYTDGIIEARNLAGEELGYEGFARLVEVSWNEDPETVYQNICSGYLRHIAGCGAQDDLTLLIVSFADENSPRA